MSDVQDARDEMIETVIGARETWLARGSKVLELRATEKADALIAAVREQTLCEQPCRHIRCCGADCATMAERLPMEPPDHWEQCTYCAARARRDAVTA